MSDNWFKSKKHYEVNNFVFVLLTHFPKRDVYWIGQIVDFGGAEKNSIVFVKWRSEILKIKWGTFESQCLELVNNK